MFLLNLCILRTMSQIPKCLQKESKIKVKFGNLMGYYVQPQECLQQTTNYKYFHFFLIFHIFFEQIPEPRKAKNISSKSHKFQQIL